MIINEQGIITELIDTLQDIYGYTKENAQEWAEAHADTIIGEMWDANSNYVAYHTEAQDEK